MKISPLILFMFLIVVMWSSGSAQHKSKYRAVIKDHEDVRYSGSFISINDSLLVMKGPPRVNPVRSITTYKDTYITFKPEEVKSIRINRKGGFAVGAALGLIGGVGLGLWIGNSKDPNTGELANDILVKLTSVVTGVLVGSTLGTVAGAQAGSLLSIRLNLKNLDLLDFTSVSGRLEPYQANIKKTF
ncbi:MAG TPA: hypothetical protein VGD22_05795 [Sphingobacteriaceae bacterium]